MDVNGHKLNAVLDSYNPIPIEVDESRSAVDPCIFKGKLDTDDQSQVLVTGGCPGEDSFEVCFIKVIVNMFSINFILLCNWLKGKRV